MKISKGILLTKTICINIYIFCWVLSTFLRIFLNYMNICFFTLDAVLSPTWPYSQNKRSLFTIKAYISSPSKGFETVFYLSHPLVINQPRICTSTCNNHSWAEKPSRLMEFVVINASCAGVEPIWHWLKVDGCCRNSLCIRHEAVC